MNKKITVQFVKFALVGVSNTLVYLVIYYLLLSFNINYLLSNILGFVISVYNAFFWSRKYVFGQGKSSYLMLLGKTYLSYGGTFILSTVCIYAFVEWFAVSKHIAPLITLLVTVPVNFLLNKFWTFK